MKKFISAILSMIMLLSVISAIPMTASANTPGTTTFTHDGYTVDYIINNVDTWNNSQGIQIIITNTGTETIENWMLMYDFCGEIENPWNVVVTNTDFVDFEDVDVVDVEQRIQEILDDLDGEDESILATVENFLRNAWEENIIDSSYGFDFDYMKNVGHNANILPGQSVNFGYTLTGFTGVPDSIIMCQERREKTNGFTVDFNVVDEWNDSFNGEIVLTNETDKPIEWWELTFDSNFTITEIRTSWSASVIENGGGNYTFKGTYTGIVAPDSSVVLGFQADKIGTPWIDEEVLTEVAVKNFGNVEPYEPKQYSNATIDWDFDGSSVLVVMDKRVGGLNKIHDPSFFGDLPIENIIDLTWHYNDEEIAYTLDNLKTFRQILKIDFSFDDKQSVLDVIEELELVDGIRSVEPNCFQSPSAIPSDPEYENQWALPLINAPEAWDMTTGSRNIRVGIIDTGIARHDDLIANVDWDNGWDFVNDNDITDDDPTDDLRGAGHGTYVAGIIGTVGNNDVGVTGVCWEVTLVPLQATELCINNKGEQFWGFNESNRVAAIQYATSSYSENDIPTIQILNHSIGGPNTLAIQQAVRRYPGLFVASVGNDGDDNDIAEKPYNDLSNIIYVGATTSTDARWNSSNFGVNSVTMFAPGENILSTVLGGTYSYASGTSAAAPHVAGVAALIQSLYPNATASQIKHAILDGADEITITDPDNNDMDVIRLRTCLHNENML